MGRTFVNISAKQEINMAEQENKEVKVLSSNYGCEILLEKTEIEKTKDKSFPTDARIISYVVDGKTYIDLTRCRKMSELFDMYYDKYGPGAVQKIDFGYGTVNPKMWGYQPPEKKKKR